MFSKFAVFFNNIFRYLIIFCISFIWINFYYHSFIGSVLISLVITCVICFLISHFYYKKTNKIKLSKQENEIAENQISQLMFYDTSEVLNLIYTSLKDSVEILNNEHGLKIKNSLIIPCFNKFLDENTYLHFYSDFIKSGQKKLIILCVNTTDSFHSFINNFENMNAEIVIGVDVYTRFLKPFNIMVENKVTLKKSTKIKLTELKNIAFSRKNAKSYFISGVFILIASLFYRFSLYYQIFGSILFALSLFSYFNTSFNQKNEKDLIE